jgi:hypothetical protein
MKLFTKLKSEMTFFKPQKENRLSCDLAHKIKKSGCIILVLLKLNTVKYQSELWGVDNEK